MIDIIRNPLFINTSQIDPLISISAAPTLAQTIITFCLNHCIIFLANLLLSMLPPYKIYSLYLTARVIFLKHKEYLNLSLLNHLVVSYHQVYRKTEQKVSVQFSAVTQSCLTVCDPINNSTSGLAVHHQLPEFTQSCVHWLSDAIQPSHPLRPHIFSPPSPHSFPFINVLLLCGTFVQLMSQY